MALKLISRGSSHRHPSLPIVCPVKNERYLVPHFIQHHREIGIDCFIFIDNDSNDGTTDYLLEQPDCVVYHTKDSWAHSRFAADWVSELLKAHTRGDWGIYLDCDELLVYEDMKTTSLAAYLRAYTPEGVDSFYALMIDMYPEGPWANVSAGATAPLLTTMNCFDKDYVIRRQPTRPWLTRRPDAIEVLGGPRCRLFSTLDRDARRGWMQYALAGQVERFASSVPLGLMPTLAAMWPRTMQAYFKTPINFIGPSFRYPYSHESSNHHKAPVMLGILHFKFYDLNARFDPVSSHLNDYQHGIQPSVWKSASLDRFQLAHALQRWGEHTLAYAGTRRYESSTSLSRYGLIGERPACVWAEGAEFYRTGQDAT